jgi:3-isopropylmalate dehydrogenase
VLLGAVGGPQWSDPDSLRCGRSRACWRCGASSACSPTCARSPRTRRCYAASPLKEHLLEGVDILFVRELTGGIYFGDKTRDAMAASDLCRYTREEIERVLRLAFGIARSRRGCSFGGQGQRAGDLAAVARDWPTRIGREEFPDVRLEHALVDAAAMQLIQAPPASTWWSPRTCSATS